MADFTNPKTDIKINSDFEYLKMHKDNQMNTT